MSDELPHRWSGSETIREGIGDDLRRGTRRGRRRIGVVATLAALAALAAPTAFALHGSIIDFFQSEPAPRHVASNSRARPGAPLGMATQVIDGQTRRSSNGSGMTGGPCSRSCGAHQNGGFCMRVDGSVGGGGCGLS